MPRPRFSEMLVSRRRQLGLSVTQASKVLRLKEQVLIAFEEGDFQHMPKSGYAQGMLSSYARYLGLNSRQVVNQFTSDLYDYEHGGRRGRSVPGTQVPREADSYEVPGRSRPVTPYRGPRGLLPTSGGYAGDVSSFATTSSPRPKGQASPLVDYRRSYSERSVPPGGRRYTSREVPSSGSAGAARQRYRGQTPRGGSPRRSGEELPHRGSDRVTTRRVRPSDYQDDMRYGEASPYEAASTASGRVSSRNIASTERPNVRRRGQQSGREQLRDRGRRRRPRHGGVLGAIESFFSDPARAMVTLALAAVLIITLVIIGSVRSCMSSGDTSTKTVSVASASSSDSSSSDSNDSKIAAAKEAAAAAAAAKAQQDAEAANTETDVKVSVSDGGVSWVEIVCDGTSEVAEQVTGPWEKTYVVTDSITIQVSDPSVVTVTKNGTQQKFDSKTSGIGSITIQGTQVTATDASSTDSANGATATTTTDVTTDGSAQATNGAITSPDASSTDASSSN
jgi:hypothetical protein